MKTNIKPANVCVDDFMMHERNGVLYRQVKWETNDESEDLKWQPFVELREDVPDMGMEYIKNANDQRAQTVFNKYEMGNYPPTEAK